MTDIAKAAVTVAESELRKTQDRIAGDSFVSFATKCCLIIDESPNKTAAKGKVLSDLGVTYGGPAVTKAMLTAVLYFTDRFDSRAIDLFRNIEFKHGREVMTGAYSKLSRLGGLCGSFALGGMTHANIASFFLEYLKFALDYEIKQTRDVTAEWLDKQKDGTPGALATVLGRQQLVMLVGSWVEDLAQSPGHSEALHKELVGIMPMFGSYVAYEKCFPVKVAEAGSEEEEGDVLAEPQGTDNGGDAIDNVKKRFKNLASHAVIDFLYDLLSGVHDKGVKDAVRASTLKDAKWLECSGLGQLRDVFRMLTAHRAMVQIGGGPPALEGRTLKRWQSDAAAGEDPEREAELKKERQEA